MMHNVMIFSLGINFDRKSVTILPFNKENFESYSILSRLIIFSCGYVTSHVGLVQIRRHIGFTTASFRVCYIIKKGELKINL